MQTNSHWGDGTFLLIAGTSPPAPPLLSERGNWKHAVVTAWTPLSLGEATSVVQPRGEVTSSEYWLLHSGYSITPSENNNEFHRGTYVGKSRNFYFYSVRNRLELSIGDDTIVKCYKGDLSNSFYTKWEWFKNLPTVKQFIEQHNK